jgi:hypothetical protein
MYIELVVVVSYLDVYVWPGNTFVNSNVIAVVPGCGSHDKTRKRSEQYWIPVSIDFRRGQWFSLPPVAAAGRVLLSSLVQYSSIYSLDVLATGSVTILSLMAIELSLLFLHGDGGLGHHCRLLCVPTSPENLCAMTYISPLLLPVKYKREDSHNTLMSFNLEDHLRDVNPNLPSGKRAHRIYSLIPDCQYSVPDIHLLCCYTTRIAHTATTIAPHQL